MDIYPRVNEFMHLSQSCHKSILDILSLFDRNDRHRQLAGRGI